MTRLCICVYSLCIRQVGDVFLLWFVYLSAGLLKKVAD